METFECSASCCRFRSMIVLLILSSDVSHTLGWGEELHMQWWRAGWRLWAWVVDTRSEGTNQSEGGVPFTSVSLWDRQVWGHWMTNLLTLQLLLWAARCFLGAMFHVQPGGAHREDPGCLWVERGRSHRCMTNPTVCGPSRLLVTGCPSLSLALSEVSSCWKGDCWLLEFWVLHL